jgi:hypothetical protein
MAAALWLLSAGLSVAQPAEFPEAFRSLLQQIGVDVYRPADEALDLRFQALSFLERRLRILAKIIPRFGKNQCATSERSHISIPLTGK